MPWYVYLFIVYIVLDRLGTWYIAGGSRHLKITESNAILATITGALMIWMVVHLAVT